MCMAKEQRKYNVYYGYELIATGLSIDEAQQLCDADIRKDAVAYKLVHKTETKVADIQGIVHKVVYIMYQFRTLYYKTYVLIEADNERYVLF